MTATPRSELPPHPSTVLLPGEQTPCDGMTEEFFPEHDNWAATRLAPLCAGCRVRPECLEWALHVREHGIWAGTTEADRIAIRKRRGIRAVGPVNLKLRYQSGMEW